jgi:hypothetical protein
MFNAQIKRDLQALAERTELLERQVTQLRKKLELLKNPSNAPEPAAVRRPPRLRRGHSERYLVHRAAGGIDIGASLKAINRTIYEIMAGSWPKNSAESRIDLAVRCATPGQGGLLSREAWLRANPEQMDLFR